MQVLVVDDEKALREIYKLLIPRIILGAEVEVASNGREGVVKATELLPDLIILDGTMPVMGGIAALRELKQNIDTRKIPVFIISGDVGDIEAQALALGATVVLQKPVTPELLSEAMTRNLSA